MFEQNAKALAQDRKLYNASDATTANRLAGQILEQLGAAVTQEQSEWSAMQPRVWTLLSETYEEVARGGRFLFAKDRGEERFPSLIAVGRTPLSRGASREASPIAAPAEGAPAAGNGESAPE
jgi:hypothetical protein